MKKGTHGELGEQSPWFGGERKKARRKEIIKEEKEKVAIKNKKRKEDINNHAKRVDYTRRRH